MASKRTILCLIAMSLMGSPAWSTPEDDQVAAYLKAHEMTGLLEVQLEQRIGDAKDSGKRASLAEELGRLYLDQLLKLDRDDPYRQIVVNRANALTKRMSSSPMYALRLELLIESYLGVESAVELSRLDLLDEAKRQEAIGQLAEINRSLSQLVAKIDPEVAKQERLRIRAKESRIEEIQTRLSDLRRFRSLGHYYHGWTGYSLAVLKGQHVPMDVFVSFGWLLGSEGQTAQFSELNESTIEFEHVARSAIGVALSYAQSEDAPAGRAWAKLIAESKYTQPDAREAAEDRLLQIMAIDRDWTDAYEFALSLERKRGEKNPMRVSDARFLALQSLEAMRSTRVGDGGMSGARKVAGYAIEQLVELKEIGHVLDLSRRFDSLPMLAESFITSYANALAELSRAEQGEGAGMYASVASLFAQALEAPDADRFPDERDDCSLKLAYAEMKSGRPTQSIKITEALIESSVKDEIIEEARWIRIAAFDAININANKPSSKPLDQAVREYITAYSSTPRAAQLILRHAMQGTIDARVAIDSLSSINDDDPIVLPARRTLLQLRYQQLKSIGFNDSVQIGQLVEMVQWLIAHQASEIKDIHDARAQIATVRIGLDLVLRIPDPNLALADRLVERGMGLIAFDQSLGIYRAEFVYRQVEIALLNNRFVDALEMLGELDALDPPRADSARILIFNDVLDQWQQRKDVELARRVISLGSGILAKQTPAYPEPMGIQMSTLAETVAQAGLYLWETLQDEESHRLALRLSILVLDRGTPSEPGLRRTAALAAKDKDYKHELDAWLRILAAYPSDDERWYEARYESLRVMKQVDFKRAINAYDQFLVLHPNLGPAPWNERIAALFGDSIQDEVSP